MLREASSLRIWLIAIDFESAQSFVNQMEIELNFMKGIVENSLVTGNRVGFAVDLTQVRSHFVLTGRQLRYISHNLMPDWACVMKPCLKLLFEATKPTINISNPRYQ